MKKVSQKAFHNTKTVLTRTTREKKSSLFSKNLNSKCEVIYIFFKCNKSFLFHSILKVKAKTINRVLEKNVFCIDTYLDEQASWLTLMKTAAKQKKSFSSFLLFIMCAPIPFAFFLLLR